MNYRTTIAFAKDVKSAIDDCWKLVLSKEKLVDKNSTLFADSENSGFALRESTFPHPLLSFRQVTLYLSYKTLKTIDACLTIDARLNGNLV